MKNELAAAALTAMITTVSLPTGAIAQRDEDRSWQGDRDGDWDPARHYRDGEYSPRELSENDRVYRGSDGRYYCKRSNGTTGLVAGGLAGGTLGAILGGGGLIGILIGGAAGSLLGKSVDKGEVRCR